MSGSWVADHAARRPDEPHLTLIGFHGAIVGSTPARTSWSRIAISRQVIARDATAEADRRSGGEGQGTTLTLVEESPPGFADPSSVRNDHIDVVIGRHSGQCL